MAANKKTAPRSVFRDSALLSRLLTQQQIDQAIAAIHAAKANDELPTPLGEVSDDDLAAKLVELGLLTIYQADQLKAGRTKLNLGPYTITDWIGQGGMGQVFKAVHSMMGRECAIKVLPLSKSTPEAIESFRREIRTQAQLDHPNLVRAYDAGHDGNVHYLVTEYVPGTDLRQLVRRQGPLTMQQAAKIIAYAARGLEYAHNRGLIHRDVKPGNILVTPEGVAKVSDLGLSGFIHPDETDSRAGKIVGTADYFSPEQIKSPNEVGETSDIYSLGCTLYYAISGKVPFPGGTAREKARKHCEDTPWHPRRFNVDVSEEFVEVVADMMEKNPADRIQTAAEVVLRLEPWASQEGVLPSQQLTKSPWLPPPFPSDEEIAGQLQGDEDRGLQDTNVGSDVIDDAGSGPSETNSQISQATDPSGPLLERRRSPRPKPPPLRRRNQRSFAETHAVSLALAIAIPISMLTGALITFLLMNYLH